MKLTPQDALGHMAEAVRRHKPNLLDRAISSISPTWGAKRATARQALIRSEIRQTVLSNAYEAVDSNRLRTWSETQGSADADILVALPTLRERSRHLVRNDPLARRVQNYYATEIAGAKIRPQATLRAEKLGLTEDEANQIEQAQEDYWETFAKSCDITGVLHFQDYARQVVKSFVVNGESITLIRRVDYPGRPVRLALQIVESDRLLTPYNYKKDGIENEIRGGVEVDSNGRPVAYYILKKHPGDTYSYHTMEQFDRIPAFDEEGRPNVLHFFEQDRPGQTRGVPLMHSIMNTLKDRGQYLEAERVAAQISAFMVLFISSPNPEEDAEAYSTLNAATGKREETLAPGTIIRGVGEEQPHFLQATKPGVTFDPFVKTIDRDIAAGTDIAYHALTGDYTGTNYSSDRSSMLSVRRYLQYIQESLSSRNFQPIWKLAQEEAFLNGAIMEAITPSEYYGMEDEWTRCRWIMQKWGFVDPNKEVQASISAIEACISTLDDEAAAQGRDAEENIRIQGRLRRLMKSEGLIDEQQSTLPTPGIQGESDSPDSGDPANGDSPDGNADDGSPEGSQSGN